MTAEIVLFMFTLLWITMFIGFVWGIKILWDMAGRTGEIQAQIRAIKVEIAAINTRLDRIFQERNK